MARVGIMSMQRIVNYGSFLQAYALKSILEGMGHDVQFVDYHVEPPLLEQGEKHETAWERNFRKVLETLKYEAPVKHRIQYIIYKKRFAEKYHNILGLTRGPNYTPEVDTLIVGSDEVFNCVQTNPAVGYSLELFGKHNRAKKLITYAASFGNTTIDKLEEYGCTEEIGALLEQFGAISVRDENSAKIVRQLCGKEVLYHMDPVLVYDYTKHIVCRSRKGVRERYLLLYAYSDRISPEESDIIAAYAKRRGWKVYAIGGIQKCADRFISCEPLDIFSYFLHAEAVITDTFHGTIFSVITKRPFAVLVRNSNNNRYGNEEKLTDLLTRLCLTEQIVESNRTFELCLENDIDYMMVEHVIQQERRRTMEYLNREIKSK